MGRRRIGHFPPDRGTRIVNLLMGLERIYGKGRNKTLLQSVVLLLLLEGGSATSRAGWGVNTERVLTVRQTNATAFNDSSRSAYCRKARSMPWWHN